MAAVKFIALPLVLTNLVAALPLPPQGQCVVDLNDSGYSSLAIRPVACNNEPALIYLTNGQTVENLNDNAYGCGYEYSKVSYTAPDGQVYVGWMGSDWLQCNTAPIDP